MERSLADRLTDPVLLHKLEASGYESVKDIKDVGVIQVIEGWVVGPLLYPLLMCSQPQNYNWRKKKLRSSWSLFMEVWLCFTGTGKVKGADAVYIKAKYELHKL